MTQEPDSPLFADAHNAAERFLQQWVTAWNRRDASSLASLHSENAVTINRYGTLLHGRLNSEKALAFLLGPQGPFGDFVFPPMKIVRARQVVPEVVIAQATWSAPVLGEDGNMVPDQFNDMILSYTLLKEGKEWKATQIDGHNVDKMNLPFSSEQQKH